MTRAKHLTFATAIIAGDGDDGGGDGDEEAAGGAMIGKRKRHASVERQA